MKHNFEKALKMVLKHEGGFVNHPHDPGGATNKGITLVTYEDFLQETVGQEALVTEEDLKNIPDEDVAEIYKTRYWDKIWGDKLPDGLDFALFDFAVNSGPTRAVKELQKIFFSCKTDGIMGPQTFEEVWDPTQLYAWQKIEISEGKHTEAYFKEELIRDRIKLLMERREKFLKTLKHYDHFCRGWHTRCEQTKREADLLCEQINSGGE